MPNTLAAASAVVLLATAAGCASHDGVRTASVTGGSVTLDPSFSGDGILTRDFAGHDDEAASVTVVSDGGILVDAFAGGRSVVLGYRSDGSRDASFGQHGVLRTVAAGSVVEQPDGKLLLLGSTRTGVAVGRFSREGSRDRSFGRGGVSVIGKDTFGGRDCIGSPVSAALMATGASS
jgi:hypothetical protein